MLSEGILEGGRRKKKSLRVNAFLKLWWTLSVPLGGVSAPRAHRACTARAPRQVFEQLLQEMVYGERSCRWYLLGSEALPFPLIGSG